MECQFLNTHRLNTTLSELCKSYLIPILTKKGLPSNGRYKHCSSTFVVDVTCLSHHDDIKKDMYGKWLYKGSHTDVFRCTFSDDGGKLCVEKVAHTASGSNVYYLRRLHSVHPSNKNFKRIVAIVFGEYV